MKTFIRWMGNKSKYLKSLTPHVPQSYDTYVEPFVGSGALFLYLKPPKWIINDTNTDLINLWKLVYHRPQIILKMIKAFQQKLEPLSFEEKKLYCKHLTNQLATMKSGFQRSIIILMMKHLAYMGHIITNNKYIFPGYTNKPIHMFTDTYRHNLLEIGKFMKNTNGEIYNNDYKKILQTTKQNDFVFLDPPYIEHHNYQFSYNIRQTLDNTFLKELKSEVKKLDKKGVKWMMTQADTDEVRRTFNGYNIHKFKVFRKQSNTNKHELIIKNY